MVHKEADDLTAALSPGLFEECLALAADTIDAGAVAEQQLSHLELAEAASPAEGRVIAGVQIGPGGEQQLHNGDVPPVCRGGERRQQWADDSYGELSNEESRGPVEYSVDEQGWREFPRAVGIHKAGTVYNDPIHIRFALDLPEGAKLRVRWAPGQTDAEKQFAIDVDGANVGESCRRSEGAAGWRYDTFPLPASNAEEHTITLRHLEGDGVLFDYLSLEGYFPLPDPDSHRQMNAPWEREAWSQFEPDHNEPPVWWPWAEGALPKN